MDICGQYPPQHTLSMFIADSSNANFDRSDASSARPLVASNSATSPTCSDHGRASSPISTGIGNINTDDCVLDVHFHHIPLANAALVARFRAGNTAPELLAAKHILWLPSLHAGLVLWRLVAALLEAGIMSTISIKQY